MDKVSHRNDSAELAQSGQSFGDLAADAWHEMFAAAAEASRIASLNGSAERAPQQESQHNNHPQLSLPRLAISDPSEISQGSMKESADFVSLEQALNQIGLHSLNRTLRTQELSHETSVLDKALLLAQTKAVDTDNDSAEKLKSKPDDSAHLKEREEQGSAVQTSFTIGIGRISQLIQDYSEANADRFQSTLLRWKTDINLVIPKTFPESSDPLDSNRGDSSTISKLTLASQVSSENSFKGIADTNFESHKGEQHRNNDSCGLESRKSRKISQTKNSDLSGTVALQKASKTFEYVHKQERNQLIDYLQRKGESVFDSLKSPFKKSTFKTLKELHWKDRGWKPADLAKDRSERRTKIERLEETSKSTEAELAVDWTEKLKLEALKRLPVEAARQRFLSCLEQFKHKAAMKGMSPKEIEETCKQLSKLLETSEAQMPEEDRILAVESFILHMAFPDTCDQGHHNTCNVTTLAQRNIRRRPSLMAEMLKTTAITGSWTAPDGMKIIIAKSSLVPGAEEQSFPRAVSCDRTFATQILNSVLANDISQRRIPAEYYTQEKPQSIDDSGERLRYADGKLVCKEAPAVRVEELDAAQQRLTGESNFVIFNTYFKAPNDALVGIASPEQFDQVLREMKAQDNLPAILYVDARHKAFGGEGKANEQIPGAHVVSVTDYDSSKQLVSIANQWGSEWNRDYPLSELFLCTLPVEVSA
ncbi:MAG: hypothetical protein K2X81_04520 [Candidatus Obscuribacterales bacterium]|nr:hypothetical protein [Candidatus Obscuribacterales bacterium]